MIDNKKIEDVAKVYMIDEFYDRPNGIILLPMKKNVINVL